ncbi:MAG: hypothetical protein ISS50_04930 [Anaerolineae bacterium]|nr:hypothetical protein [Anaerolineae bacterium]
MLKRKQMQIIADAAAKCGRTDLVERMKQMHTAKVAYNREYVRDLVFQIEADRLSRHAEVEDLQAWFADERAIRQAELQALQEEVECLKAETRSQMADYAAQRREGHDVWQQYQMAIKRLRSGQKEVPGSPARVAREQD